MKPKTSQKRALEHDCSKETNKSKPTKKQKLGDEMSLEEFYRKLKISNPKAAILSIVSDHAAGKSLHVNAIKF